MTPNTATPLLKHLQDGDVIYTAFVPNLILESPITININSVALLNKKLPQIFIMFLKNVIIQIITKNVCFATNQLLFHGWDNDTPYITFNAELWSTITKEATFQEGCLLLSTSKKDLFNTIYKEYFLPLKKTLGNNKEKQKKYKKRLHELNIQLNFEQ